MKSLYDKAIQDGNKDAAEQYYAAWQEAEGKVSSSLEARIASSIAKRSRITSNNALLLSFVKSSTSIASDRFFFYSLVISAAVSLN